MGHVNLTICLHSHQPVGNFDHVFEENYRKCYLPFIEVYEDFPDLPLALHYSGPLFDWLMEKHPEFIDRLNLLVEKGNVEMVAGTYYEAILAMIPEPDRQGQIKKMKKFLKNKFGQDAAGFWLPERVWEQEMTSSLAKAGIEYTIVDDTHLLNAGLTGKSLLKYYITEDHGRTLNIYATHEKLRYIIPFKEPGEIRDYLGEIAESDPGALLVYGDDGEKFGGWPQTYKWVYTEKWLEKFFSMLRDNREWIHLHKPRDILGNLKPAGKIYMPDSSYREMTEWALPVSSALKCESVVDRLKESELWEDASAFIRGGFWRNFKYKYPEANQMYARMLEVSKNAEKSKNEAARDYLYKAQCNCPYWHGVFGGLYLNHLRFETYKNMIKSEKLLLEEKGVKDDIIVEKRDLDFDGRDEISIRNRWNKLYIQPHSGGRIYEWDNYSAETNLLDTLSRREEAYHKEIIEASEIQEEEDVKTIHGSWKLKDLSMKNDLIYDDHERKSFLDHIILGEIDPDKLQRNECLEPVKLPLHEYDHKIEETAERAVIDQSTRAEFDNEGIRCELLLSKTLTVEKNSGDLVIEYKIVNRGGQQASFSFGTEWNFAMLAGDAPDRYYFLGTAAKSGKLIKKLNKKNTVKFGIVDEWQKLRISFEFSEPVTLFTFPIQTISQSESAYEKVYQSSVIYPVLKLDIDAGKERSFSFHLRVENSVKL
ncbi:alpha-amylase/4-alpha-glucanotransferase domain-containing protein [candidate division KSB1 bacterium]